MISERDPMSQQCKCLSNSEPRWHASWCPVYQEWKAEKDRKKDEIGEAERALGETSAADMANAGARKELEGFSDAFPERDRLLAMEAEAAQRRSAVQTVVGMLVSSVNAATPFELREAARALDDTANNPATNARDRKLYRALSDVVKLALK